MDKADDELRKTVKKLWPFMCIEKINLAIPPKQGEHIPLINIYCFISYDNKKDKCQYSL